MVKRRWSNRSAIIDETRRPTVSPAQYSDSARVAVVSGAGSRKRTIQFETPISDATYAAIASPSNSNGPASSDRPSPPPAAPGRGAPALLAVLRPLGIGTRT